MLKAIIDFDEKKFCNLTKGIIPKHPYVNIKNLKILCNIFNCSLLFITLQKHSQIDWIGAFFLKKIKDNNYLFSGGRFGFAGFIPIKATFQINDYLKAIEKEVSFLNLASMSLSITYLVDYKKFINNNGWIETEKIY